MIIYRVAKGAAWSNDSNINRTVLSDIRFEVETTTVRDPVQGDPRTGTDIESAHAPGLGKPKKR